MSLRLSIKDGRGTRQLGTEQLPLGIGRGDEAHISLPGAGPEAVLALVDMAQDNLFVQPVGGASVLHNGRLLEQSGWLQDGDSLTIDGAELHVNLSPGVCLLRVEPHASANQTRPPTVPPPSPAPGPLQPAAFKPAGTGTPRSGPPRRRLSLLLAATLVLLAAAAWFVLSARFVTIQVTPEPDNLVLSGGLLRLELADGYLLRPGQYTVIAEKVGYHRSRQTLNVSRERNQSLVLELKKLPGRLTLRTVPEASAQVTIDGIERGTAPLTVDGLEPGRHQVLVRSERYLDARTAVEIEGRGVEQTLETVLVPRWAEVTVSSATPGAELWVDGEQAGQVPITVEIFEGERALEIRKERYKPWRQSLTVVANQPQTLPEITLEQADGILQLGSQPAGANVTIDGEYAGQTPLEVALSAEQEHRIVFSKAGYAPATHLARLEAAASDTVAVTLKAVTGTVHVNAEPSDARLFVNGKPRGRANQRLTLATVPHTIEVRKSGYETYRIQIVPRRDFAQRVEVRLKPAKAARLARMPSQITAADGQTLRLIRSGELTMGASRREQGRRANETLRKVRLIRPFYLGVKEITNRQFRQFQPGHSSQSFTALSLSRPDQPVVNITWEQAAEYCNWLSAKDKLPPVYEKRNGRLLARDPVPAGYRLPTEAEWALAARTAGQKPTRYPWGDALPPTTKAGNYADSAAARVLANTLDAYSDGFPATAPPGSFQANPLGIYDLGGNVAEWVHDYYTIYPTSTSTPEKDPTGPGEGKHHVIRGSSWMHASISALRWTYRDYGDEPRPDVGFRIARYAE